MSSSSWLRERSRSIRTWEGLIRQLSPLREERDFFAEPPKEGLEFTVTPHYLSLIRGGAEDPIRKQCIPRIDEARVLSYESSDPLEELSFSPVPRLVHRYADRALLMVTDECAVYCRHCFRRHFSGGRRGAVSPEELRDVSAYLASHREVKELLLSGGDPLTLTDGRLRDMLDSIREARPDIVLRIATRIPVVLPSRISSGLAELFAEYAPLFLVTQYNHPAEFVGKSSSALRRIVRAGTPILNQAVLLRGVNDDPAVLEELFHLLASHQVFSYYLFQGDLAAGTSHFRVPLSEGMQIVRSLRQRLSGIAMPVYAVDLPGGGGKVPLTENYMFSGGKSSWATAKPFVSGGAGPGRRVFRFTSPEGGVYEYPDESGTCC